MSLCGLLFGPPLWFLLVPHWFLKGMKEQGHLQSCPGERFPLLASTSGLSPKHSTHSLCPLPPPPSASSVSRQSRWAQLNPEKFLKGYTLEALHSAGSTCWSLHRLPGPLNRETNCGEAAFQHTGWALLCGFYYQKAFKRAVELLLNISQWIKYHFSPHSCSVWVSGVLFFFSWQKTSAV